MPTAAISSHFARRKPSPIRQAQILFAERPDRDTVAVVNLAIGNVSLPMHPAMQARMKTLGQAPSPFAGGVVKYSASVGSEAAQRTFLHLIGACDYDVSELRAVVTDGGSQAMELMILGVAGPASERPVLLVDPAYTNYVDIAKRVAAPTVAVRRFLREDGTFDPPDLEVIARAIEAHDPCAMVVVPADNPTGQFITPEVMTALGRLCVEHNIWLVSDEAYRQLHYNDHDVSSVWGIDRKEVPGIAGRRISIESASKVWNACGLRIGALVTDNLELHAKAVAEYTANLCSNVIGQHIFAALADESEADLRRWYDEQRDYYRTMMGQTVAAMREAVPGLIMSNPEASLYSVIDVRNCVPEGFDAGEFVAWCAQHGAVEIDGKNHTLLVAPLGGFYAGHEGEADASATQLRLAYVAPPSEIAIVPRLFAGLLATYLAR